MALPAKRLLTYARSLRCASSPSYGRGLPYPCADSARILFFFLVVVVLASTTGRAQSDPTPMIDSAGVSVPDPASGSSDTVDASALFDTAVIHRFDSSLVKLRSFDTAAIGSYRRDDAFDYDRVRDPTSLWDRFVRWVMEGIRDLMPDSVADAFDDFLHDWLPWIVIVGALGVVGGKLYRARMGGLLGEADRGLVGDMDELTEDVTGVDLERAIAEAADSGRYRRAVRLLYLRALRDLAERDLIDYRRERTNADYLKDLSNRPIGPLFEQITLLFEFIWYGDQSIDRLTFPRVHESFTRFQRQLQEGIV